MKNLEISIFSRALLNRGREMIWHLNRDADNGAARARMLSSRPLAVALVGGVVAVGAIS